MLEVNILVLAIIILVFLSRGAVACKNGYIGPGYITLHRSSSGNLCKLVKVTVGGTNIIPVARSYDALDWEAVAGAFSTLSYTCSSDSCSTTLPDIESGEKYDILESSHSLSKQNELARFLEQATFGTTREDLRKFDSSIGTDVSITSWIYGQMYDKQATLHREWFRRRANHRYPKPLPPARTFHACEKNTRYRKYAFSRLDKQKKMQIKKVGSKFVLSVEGQIRTVVDQFDWYDDWYIEENGHFDAEELEAEICYLEDCLYCWIEIYDQKTDQCVGIKCTKGEGQKCNPPIKFDSSMEVPTTLVQLPNDKIRFINQQYDSPGTKQELIVTNELDDFICESISEGYSSIPVFGLIQILNEYYIHDPPPRLLSNQLNEPLLDGGSQSRAYSAGRTQCSNTPRTFLNSDTCKLSDDITACRVSGEPTIEILLDERSLKRLYDFSLKDDSMRTSYIYAIDSLRIESDSDTDLPCHDQVSTRWLRVKEDNSCAPNDLTIETKEYLRDRISWSEDTENPLLRDVWLWDNECHKEDLEKKGFEIYVYGTCWRHVHQDHLTVYDMTYWTYDDTHPGNSPKRNPIKEFAEDGKSKLEFPSWHTMDRWTINKGFFTEIGRLGDRISFGDLPSKLKTNALAIAFGGSSLVNVGGGVVVCGSPGEVSNDATLGGGEGYGAFDFQSGDGSTTFDDKLENQRRTVWSTIVFEAEDQLRQRMAWSLNQIFAIAAPSIDYKLHTEQYVAFYDIFVRNAFGNYRDILKEISYSYSMAENLSFYESKSTALYWEWDGKITYPDENFAREVMQLFSVGLCKLNLDGTPLVNLMLTIRPTRNTVTDKCIPTYSNDDVEEYARVWTGFTRNDRRGNIESEDNENNIDPMKIVAKWRDRFPKMGLNGQHIGDKYPICSDRPKQRFLKKGAKYVLLGSSSNSAHQDNPTEWSNEPNAVRITLGCNETDSKLRQTDSRLRLLKKNKKKKKKNKKKKSTKKKKKNTKKKKKKEA